MSPQDESPARTAASELDAIHRAEWSRLLLLAIGIRAVREPGFGTVTGFPVLPVALRPWRSEVDRALAAANTEGAHGPALGLLRTLARQKVRTWPTLVALARALVAVRGGERATTTLGFAYLTEGRFDEARAVFEALIEREHVLREPWRVQEGLATARATSGRARAALDALERAAEDPRVCSAAHVGCLVLSLALADDGRARRAAARLDFLVNPFDPEFEASIARWRRLRDRLGADGVERVRSGALALLGKGRSPAELVCRALL